MKDLREKIARAICDWYHEGDEPTWGDYQIADVVMQVLREQEPVAWVHPTNLVNPALGIMCSPIQLGSRQVPLYAAPMPASVPDGCQIINTALLQRASWTIGRFIDGCDWSQEDMDVMDDLDAHLCRSAPKPEDK